MDQEWHSDRRKERFHALLQEHDDREREEVYLHEELYDAYARFANELAEAQARYEEQVTAARVRYDEALAEVREQKQAIHAKMSPLAPIHTLCDDVMALIIEFACLDEHSDCFKNIRRDIHPLCVCIQEPNLPLEAHYPLWCISTTCRRFRSLAFALSTLWKCIHIGDEHDGVFAVEDCIRRSKNLPLCIVINTYNRRRSDLFSSAAKPPLPEPQELMSFRHRWDTVQAEMRRWEYLTIMARENCPLTELVRSSNFVLPALQGFSTYGIFSTEDFFMNEHTLSMPKLSVCLTTHIQSFIGRLPSMTTLKISACYDTANPQEWSSFLKGLTNLERLSISSINLHQKKRLIL